MIQHQRQLDFGQVSNCPLVILPLLCIAKLSNFYSLLMTIIFHYLTRRKLRIWCSHLRWQWICSSYFPVYEIPLIVCGLLEIEQALQAYEFLDIPDPNSPIPVLTYYTTKLNHAMKCKISFIVSHYLSFELDGNSANCDRSSFNNISLFLIHKAVLHSVWSLFA